MSPAVASPGSGALRDGLRAIVVAAIVTGIVTVASLFLPDRYIATAVGFVFLGATWLFVWRRDDATVERSGLALGGLVLPGKVDGARLGRSLATAVVWALIFAAIFFVPFYFGWRWFWHPRGTFGFRLAGMELLNEAFGQLVIIALPEEAFYRGFLQSRLEDALPGFGWSRDPGTGEAKPRRIPLFGTSIGPALFVTSLVFALGHLATIHEPTRLAVFFPSLAFGFLRTRTRGIGAGVLFHASCNIFSEILGKGFRVY